MSPKEDKPDFILHGMMDLEKSVQSAHPSDEQTPAHRLIYGLISTPGLDEEKERLIQKSLDFSYFDEKGWIKYEHEPRNEPKNIIGCPHERQTTDQGTLIKGALLEGTKFADDTWALIEAIENHNRQFPENQKCLGWSVEGNYVDGKKSKGGARKAKVINIVITPNAINRDTYLKTMQGNHFSFAKSLAATPTSTVLPEKTGVDAISGKKKKKKNSNTSENVDETVKQTAEGIELAEEKKGKKKTSKRTTKSARRTDMFKSYEEAVKFYTDNDVEEEEAKRLAKAHFPDEGPPGGDDPPEHPREATETDSLLAGLTKAVGEIKDKIFGKSEPGADLGEDLTEGLEDGEMVDVSEYLGSMEKSIAGSEKTLGEFVEYTHDRDLVMAKALAEVGQIREEVTSQMSEIKKAVFVKSGEDEIPISEAVMLLLKARAGQPIDLSQFQVAEEGGGDGTPVGSNDKMPFNELTSKLEKGVQAEKITSAEMATAEACWRTNEMDTVKSILEKCE